MNDYNVTLSKELYNEVADALYFLQLEAASHIDKLNEDGLIYLINMRFDGWDYKKTNDVINKFLEIGKKN